MSQPRHLSLLPALQKQWEELADALSLTYDTSSSSKPKAQDNVQRLATARQQILETCNQLRDYLMQLKQAVQLSPQQIEGLLQQQQQPLSSPAKSQAAQKPAAADAMDVDEPKQQDEASTATQAAAAITEQHAKFLAQLTGGLS